MSCGQTGLRKWLLVVKLKKPKFNRWDSNSDLKETMTSCAATSNATGLIYNQKRLENTNSTSFYGITCQTPQSKQIEILFLNMRLE